MVASLPASCAAGSLVNGLLASRPALVAALLLLHFGKREAEVLFLHRHIS